MLPHLAFLLLGLQTSSIYATWFPSPTGNNGLEEYAQAADLLNSPEFGVFETWRPNDAYPVEAPATKVTKLGREQQATKTDPPNIAALRDQIAALDYEKLCSLEAQRFGNILDLVRQGNGKPIVRATTAWDTENLATKLTPLIQQFTNLTLRISYARFAEGKSGLAVDALIENMNFLDRMDRVSITSSIWSGSMNASLMRLVNLHLGQLDLADCRALQAASRRLLSLTPAIRAQFDNNLAFWLEKIPKYIENESKVIPGERNKAPEGMIDDWKINDELVRMTAVQRQTLTDAALAKAKTVFALTSPRFEGPESKWLDPLPDSPFFKIGRVTDDDDLVSRILFQTRLAATTARIKSYILVRARMRLLNTHMQLLTFRWTRGRLPINLEECGKGLSADPLTNGNLKYEVRADGTYDLYSEGTKETGLIRLRPDQPASPNANRTHP